MGLRGYLLKRSIYCVFLIFFIITLNFVIFDLMPGNPIQGLIHPDFTREEMEALQEQWGLNRPVMDRYVSYVKNMLTWQFGRSFRTTDLVTEEITDRLSNTLSLVGSAVVITMFIGISLGALSAYKRGKAFDSVTVVVSTTLNAFPSFWMGMMLLLIFAFNLRLLPSSGVVPPEWAKGWPTPLLQTEILGMTLVIPSLAEVVGRIRHLILPVSALVIVSFGSWLLFARATVMEALTEDYIITAKAKGLKDRTILFKHALKNAALPLITSAAISFGFLIGGAIITEQVFTYPGIGEWVWTSLTFRDYPAMQAIFYVISLCVIIANFIADILYGVIDPRIKYG